MTISDLAQAIPKNYMISIYDSGDKQTFENALAWFAAGTYESLSSDVLGYAVESFDVQIRQNNVHVAVVTPRPTNETDPNLTFN